MRLLNFFMSLYTSKWTPTKSIECHFFRLSSNLNEFFFEGVRSQILKIFKYRLWIIFIYQKYSLYFCKLLCNCIKTSRSNNILLPTMLYCMDCSYNMKLQMYFNIMIWKSCMSWSNLKHRYQNVNHSIVGNVMYFVFEMI